MIEDIFITLAKNGPVVALLIAAVWYFLKREKKMEMKIEELNKELRESDKENVSLLIKISATLKKLTDNE